MFYILLCFSRDDTWIYLYRLASAIHGMKLMREWKLSTESKKRTIPKFQIDCVQIQLKQNVKPYSVDSGEFQGLNQMEGNSIKSIEIQEYIKEWNGIIHEHDMGKALNTRASHCESVLPQFPYIRTPLRPCPSVTEASTVPALLPPIKNISPLLQIPFRKVERRERKNGIFAVKYCTQTIYDCDLSCDWFLTSNFPFFHGATSKS